MRCPFFVWEYLPTIFTFPPPAPPFGKGRGEICQLIVDYSSVSFFRVGVSLDYIYFSSIRVLFCRVLQHQRTKRLSNVERKTFGKLLSCSLACRTVIVVTDNVSLVVG